MLSNSADESDLNRFGSNIIAVTVSITVAIILLVGEYNNIIIILMGINHMIWILY